MLIIFTDRFWRAAKNKKITIIFGNRGVAWGGGQEHVAPPPGFLFILVFGVYGMTFEGKMRNLRDKLRIKLVQGGGQNSFKGANTFVSLWQISRYAPVWKYSSLSATQNFLLYKSKRKDYQ